MKFLAGLCLLTTLIGVMYASSLTPKSRGANTFFDSCVLEGEDLLNHPGFSIDDTGADWTLNCSLDAPPGPPIDVLQYNVVKINYLFTATNNSTCRDMEVQPIAFFNLQYNLPNGEVRSTVGVNTIKFDRIHLLPGQTKTINVTVSALGDSDEVYTREDCLDPLDWSQPWVSTITGSVDLQYVTSGIDVPPTIEIVPDTENLQYFAAVDIVYDTGRTK